MVNITLTWAKKVSIRKGTSTLDNLAWGQQLVLLVFV